MMRMFLKWLAHTNILLYAVSLIAINFAIKGCVHLFKYALSIPDIQFHERLIGKTLEITPNLAIDVLIIAPILETLVFQTLFYMLLKRFKIQRHMVILCSGIAFGAIHNYSIFYMINAALMGFVFMLMYILRSEAGSKPFVSTAIAHSSINLLALILAVITRYHL